MHGKFSARYSGIVCYVKLSELVSILALCLAILLNPGCKSKAVVDNGKEIVLRLDPGPGNPRNSEGDFITLGNGRILFIYTHYTGSSGSDYGNACLMSRFSDDNGKTWSTEDQMVVNQEGSMNVMSVSLLRLQNDEIALFYLTKNSTSDCIPYMRISTDEARTWSDPVKCITDKKGYFVVNNNRLIQLKNGRLLMPVASHYVPEGGEFAGAAEQGHLFVYYSDDNGRTWKTGKEVPNPDDILAQEPGVLELKNGDIFMIIRADAGVQYLSWSKDKGETWSPAERSEIKSPLSPASIARIPSTKDLLMVWNNNSVSGHEYRKRTPLNIAVSRDEGKTWIKIKTIEDDPNGEFCYTAIHFTDKYVLLSYRLANLGSTITRLSLDWVYK